MKVQSQLNKFLCLIIAGFFISFIFTSCMQEDPISIQTGYGSITGRVFPKEDTILVNARQGTAIVASTTVDTSGGFKINELRTGVYSVDFEATGYGKYTENNVTVYEGATTAISDIWLKPFPEQISDSNPRNGQIDYPIEGIITLKFAQTMERTSVEAAFNINPLIKGHIQWNAEETEMSFIPEPQLVPSTIYQVILSTYAKTKSGENLSFNYVISFSTTPLKVVRTNPLNGTVGVSTQSGLLFSFNSVVDKNSFKNGLVINPAILGDLNWIDNKTVIFTPGTFFSPETDYSVRLEMSIQDIYGKRLTVPFIYYFRTEAARIVYNFPQNGANYVDRGTAISFSFNAEMNQQTVQQAFQISPATAGIFQWESYSKVHFRPTERLHPQTFYQIIINSTGQTLTGQGLGEQYAFSFKTSP
ncbi:Ig-like domain-containing protein [candidate division KSB1 bacterium]|nr:Ig-like domain-containing protein [candidate division KSB1 bacterium]